MPERLHEAGRRGLLEAQRHLWVLLGGGIALPFNAYDHENLLTFPDIDGRSQFSFDLYGHLKRQSAGHFGGAESADVFVEVKSYRKAGRLLKEYEEFLRRAAIVSNVPRHAASWFIFFATTPFGCKKGIELCDGTFLRDRSDEWSTINPPPGLMERIALVLATASSSRLIARWLTNVGS